MADRNLNFDPTVTQVTPTMPNLGLETGIADFADKIATMSANSKALNANAQTALQFRQLDAQYRQDTAGNPNDPQAQADLQAKRSEIMSQMSAQIPAIAQREYTVGAIELQKSSDKMNELWGMHQQVRNSKSDMDASKATQMTVANQDGQKFAADGADMGNLSSVLNFEQSQQAIRQFATPIIGKPAVDDYMVGYNADYTKSFVAGVAQNNPQIAAAMLQRPEISQHFTTQEIGDMSGVIQKTEKQQALIQNLQTTKNDGGLVDIVNDPNSGYLDKRLVIEKQIADGSVTPKAGKAAISILHTQEDVDTVTDTPVMADLVNRTYDLNSKANSKADDYLNGVKDIHQQILQAQANGSLTAEDAGKVTKQVNDLTGAKLSAATNTAGGEFFAANKQFSALPPEYRGQATRALFYAGTGQKWTPQQYSNQATQIIQQINDQRRQGAQQSLNNVQNDDTFVKSIGFTNSDIQETAKKYGMSQQDVILQLRAKAGTAARAKRGAVKSIASGADDDGSPEPASSAPARGRAPDTSEAEDMEMLQ